MKTFLIYGSYGYTGQLIVERAIKEGMRPILAGRDQRKLRAQAEKYNLEYRGFSLDETSKLDSALNEVEAVLHCAGPFVLTFRQMAEACLRTKKHYVDISGEIEGFEALARLNDQARQANIMLMPGGGFDVVPSDCLAAYLHQRLPTATHFRLFLRGVGGGVSRGTARSATGSCPNWLAVRSSDIRAYSVWHGLLSPTQTVTSMWRYCAGLLQPISRFSR